MSKAEIAKALGGRRSKYNVGGPETRTADGICFDSAHERDCYLNLKALERCGQVIELKLQVKMPLLTFRLSEPVLVAHLVLDFVTVDRAGKTTYYDAKAFDKKSEKFLPTPMARLKIKWWEAQTGEKVVFI